MTHIVMDGVGFVQLYSTPLEAQSLIVCANVARKLGELYYVVGKEKAETRNLVSSIEAGSKLYRCDSKPA